MILPPPYPPYLAFFFDLSSSLPHTLPFSLPLFLLFSPSFLLTDHPPFPLSLLSLPFSQTLQGRILYANGDHFTGHFVTGQIEGRGILKCINGMEYSGEWKHSQVGRYLEMTFEPHSLITNTQKFTWEFQKLINTYHILSVIFGLLLLAPWPWGPQDCLWSCLYGRVSIQQFSRPGRNGLQQRRWVQGNMEE